MFLDEPTSGLDSAASWEVISYIKNIAKRNNVSDTPGTLAEADQTKLIIIASIHQPSASTYHLFDKLLLLSGGKPHYFGPVAAVDRFFEHLGLPVPMQTNPAEFLLELMNVDFAGEHSDAHDRLQWIQRSWVNSQPAHELASQIQAAARVGGILPTYKPKSYSLLAITIVLIYRSFIKSYRDIVAYGIRIGMYTGLAIMMGTVWLRLHTTQYDIQPYVNAIVSVKT